MATLSHVVLIPGIPRLQLGSVSGRAHQRTKLQVRTIGVVCALRGEKIEVGKRGQKSPNPKKGYEEGNAEKVVEDPKLRLELKVKIDALECNARKARGGLRGHTLGVDLGDAKTGLSVSLGGYAPRPLTVSVCPLAIPPARNVSILIRFFSIQSMKCQTLTFQTVVLNVGHFNITIRKRQSTLPFLMGNLVFSQLKTTRATSEVVLPCLAKTLNPKTLTLIPLLVELLEPCDQGSAPLKFPVIVETVR